MALLTSSTTYSQKQILIKGDTNICFTVSQSKYLLKQVYKVNQFITLDSICEAQLSIKDSLLVSSEKQKNSLEKLVANKDTEISIREYEVFKLKEDKKNLNIKLRKQKVLKIGSFSISAASIGYILYHQITKH